MKTIACIEDLRPFGIEYLTGEACGLMYRGLYDLTNPGKQIIEKCLGVASLVLHDPWNAGTKQEPHVGSIMLAQGHLIPIGIFALLESGCTEVLQAGECLYGMEPGDDESRKFIVGRFQNSRRFAYTGTAGDRNVHQMTQRVV